MRMEHRPRHEPRQRLENETREQAKVLGGIPRPGSSSSRVPTSKAASAASERSSPEALERYRPVMLVKAPPHAQLHAIGLGRFVPATKVRVTRSTGVVAADNCLLKSTDHYHVHRATVDTQPLRDLSKAGQAALSRLLSDPTSTKAIRAFQRELPRPSAPRTTGTKITRPVAARHDVHVSRSSGVQTRSGSTMKTHTNYVVDETRLPLGELLREDDALVTSFAKAIRETEPGQETAAFCRQLLRATNEVGDLTRLAQATEFARVDDTTVLTFFGTAKVTAASAVLVGEANKLDDKLRIDLPEIGRRGLRGNLDALRDRYCPVGEPPSPSRPARDLRPPGGRE